MVFSESPMLLFALCPFGVPVKYGGKVLTGVAFPYLCHLFGRALCYNGTAACASLRAHVDYIVRALYDIEVVLYDHYRAAAVRKPLQYLISLALLDFGKLVTKCVCCFVIVAGPEIGDCL